MSWVKENHFIEDEIRNLYCALAECNSITFFFLIGGTYYAISDQYKISEKIMRIYEIICIRYKS